MAVINKNSNNLQTEVCGVFICLCQCAYELLFFICFSDYAEKNLEDSK